jgi:hypothetical protein
MNEFERKQYMVALEEVSYVERLRKIMRDADPLSDLLGSHTAAAAMRDAMHMLDEQKRLERLNCLARGVYVNDLDLHRAVRATDYAEPLALRHIAEYNATFHANSGDSWAQNEIRKQMDQSGWLATLAGPTGVEQIKKTLLNRQYPWVSDCDASASVRGFVEVQVLGGALDAYRPFGQDITLATRDVLGDWSHVTALPADIFTDSLARSTFYLERGYDPAVADFPVQTFHENLRYAGFADTATASDEETDEEAAKRRTSEAQALLCEFEREMRQFIGEQLEACAGSNWPKHRVDAKVYEGWKEKRQTDRTRRSVDLPLIDYVDLSEYERIFTRKDNWREVFQTYFEREESIRESLFRLMPLRNAAMHARFLTQDDWVFLQVEVKRLRIAITRTSTFIPDDDAYGEQQ